ncbi:hypothetical protein DFJ77DRAFT_466582 [Powellomyces hirtus]|nr:hypothetical protein DFJ77DRAFT_466582 [Powellomyces hirtus]
MTHTNSKLHATTLFSLHGLVAVVTGGGTGIGLMAAEALATNGATVYITGRRLNVLEAAAETHGKGLAGTMVPLQCDVGDKESLGKVAREIERREGRVHVLVNNAGVEGPVTMLDNAECLTAEQLSAQHLKNESYNDWDNLFRINTHALFFATMAFLPLLAKGNGAPRANWTSAVINVTSVSGIIKYSQNHYAYNASKAAANHITRTLAHDLNFRSKLNLRINALAPGLFATEMTAGPSVAGKSATTALGDFNNPAARAGEEDDIAAAILFLACSQYTAGQILAVDGGYTTALAGTQ